MFTSVDTSWRPIPELVADLDVDGRDYVMFSGHVDSWHYGAMDNASANATMIETARMLADNRESLRRGVRFAFWSGHSHARYAGSTWFADTTGSICASGALRMSTLIQPVRSARRR